MEEHRMRYKALACNKAHERIHTVYNLYPRGDITRNHCFGKHEKTSQVIVRDGMRPG